MYNPYSLIINLIVLRIFAFAFYVAENKHRLALEAVAVMLFVLPLILPFSGLKWIIYGEKKFLV